MSEINTSRSSKVSLTSLFRGLRAFLIDETSLIENDFSCSTTHNRVKSNYEGEFNSVAVGLGGSSTKNTIIGGLYHYNSGVAEGVKIWGPCALNFSALAF